MLRALGLIFLHVAVAAASFNFMPIEEFAKRYRIYADECVGAGSFSNVFCGVEMQRLPTLPDGSVADATAVGLSHASNVCIKVTVTPTAKYNEVEIFKQMNALQKIGRSEHIIKIYNTCKHIRPRDDAHIEIYAAQEFANGGNLSQVISHGLLHPPAELAPDAAAAVNLRVELIGRILGHILLALQQMHTSGFAHCDLKPSNIVLSAPGVKGHFAPGRYIPELSFQDLQCATYKLVDFDFLKSLGTSPAERSLKEASGTTAYASPAQLNWTWDYKKRRLATDPYGAGADIWALGLTAYKLWTQSYMTDLPMFTALLNPDPNVKETIEARISRMHAIKKAWETFVTGDGLAQAIKEFPIELQVFITACLTLEEAGRPTATELLCMEFITRALNGTSVSSLPPPSTTTAIDIESSSILQSFMRIVPPHPPAVSSDQTVCKID